MRNKLSILAVLLIVAQLLLVLASWILSAAMPLSGIRSILSGEGLRWFLGHFADMMATPILVWILLLAMAYGVVRRSKLFRYRSSYRGRNALWLSLFLLLVIIGIVSCMTVVPHAVLLSASGTLWPSPFSFSLIPLIAFSLMSIGFVYGGVSGNFQSLYDVYNALIEGICLVAPIIPLYVLATQFYYTLCFVLP